MQSEGKMNIPGNFDDEFKEINKIFYNCELL